MTNTQAIIMRRVYYSLFLRLLTLPVLWQGITLGVCLYLFGRLTHVASIMTNLGATSLSNTPNFVLGAFKHALNEGQILTVLVTLFMVMISISVIVRFVRFFLNAPRRYRPV